jgi:hypothetical protein
MERGNSPTLIRPAILEAVLVLTASAIAIESALEGLRLQSTSLMEFGILSTLVAASAALLVARYAVQIWGLLADGRRFEHWATRCRTICYLGLGVYALLNGFLDLAIPRHSADPISYPGLMSTQVAVIVVALVLETKYRVLQSLPSRSLFESLPDNILYLAIGVIILVVLVGHVFAPLWWLDTSIDAVFIVLVMIRLRGNLPPSAAGPSSRTTAR